MNRLHEAADWGLVPNHHHQEAVDWDLVPNKEKLVCLPGSLLLHKGYQFPGMSRL